VRHEWQTLRARRLATPLVLLVLFILFLLLGIIFRPSDSGPAPIPSTPNLSLSIQSGAPRQISIASFLEQARGSRVVLDVQAAGTFAQNQATVGWALVVQGFTGYNCTPNRNVSFFPLRRNAYVATQVSPVPKHPGDVFFTVELCWQENSPLVSSGSYFSADLAPIMPPGNVATGSVTRSVALTGTSLSDYALAGGLAPTRVSPRSWTWVNNLSIQFGSQTPEPVPVIGSSIPLQQRDNRYTFYSGISLGIAGGAFVAVFPTLIDAADHRKKKVKHETPEAE
jgi:hypothetical protein